MEKKSRGTMSVRAKFVYLVIHDHKHGYDVYVFSSLAKAKHHSKYLEDEALHNQAPEEGETREDALAYLGEYISIQKQEVA